ncbi:hypothetical protein CHISP_1121 [Chitinispirillum alkaliphilum]|nr:hypothetical protein CHISP_1121 [Chitinispirillum alkaliphilum]
MKKCIIYTVLLWLVIWPFMGCGKCEHADGCTHHNQEDEMVVTQNHNHTSSLHERECTHSDNDKFEEEFFLSRISATNISHCTETIYYDTLTFLNYLYGGDYHYLVGVQKSTADTISIVWDNAGLFYGPDSISQGTQLYCVWSVDTLYAAGEYDLPYLYPRAKEVKKISPPNPDLSDSLIIDQL